MQTIGFLHALTFIICFIPIGGSLINPEGAIDLKIIEQSDKDSRTILPQDARKPLKSHIHPVTDIDRRNKHIVKNGSKKDKDFQKELSSVDGHLSPGGSNSNNMLSAYAPEFGPLDISNPSSALRTQRIGTNCIPHDVSSGVQMLESQHPLTLIPVQLIGQQYHNIMEMQPVVFLQHIDKQNQHISSGQRAPSRQSYNHRKTRLSRMSSRAVESDISLNHHTADGIAGRSEHDKQSMNLEALPNPMIKDGRIQQSHRSSMVGNMSTNNGKSKKGSIRHFVPDSNLSKEGTQKDNSPPQFVKVPGSLNIKNKNFHRLQKSLKPVKLRVETLEEKEHHQELSEPTPLAPVQTQIELRIDQGKIPKMPWNKVLDPLKSNSRSENQGLMEAPDEASIKRSAPRGNHHEYQSSDSVGIKIPETEILAKISKDRDEWIIPKKTVKSNQISKMNVSQGAEISELPKLQNKSSSDPLKPLETFKVSLPKLKKSSKKHKKKTQANSNSNASKIFDDNWDRELLEALKGTSVSEQNMGTEHEKLIKNIQKRLQNVFVSEGHRKSDVPSSSSHPWHDILIEEFVCLDNHTPLLELKLKSETVERFRLAEKEDPMTYNTSFWLKKIDEVLLDKGTSVAPLELLRRKRAFLAQYLSRRDSEITKEQKHTWSQEGREVATSLRLENPFEMFLDSTQEEIKVLERYLEGMNGSEKNALSNYLSKDYLKPRSIMIYQRRQELENQSPYRFFDKDFLEKAYQQGLHIPRFRQFETALELSAPEVSWQGLHEDDLEAKYSQVLNVLAGMPEKLPMSLEDTETYLYFQAKVNWINSPLQQLVNNDPEVLNHVTNRFKLLLMALKGKKTSHKIWHNLKFVSPPNSNVEQIPRDEALAAAFVGLSLERLTRFKIWLRASQIGVQGKPTRRFISWPEALQESEEVKEAFKRFYELLGIKLFTKD